MAYSEDGKHLYLFTGEPAGYFHRGSIYTFAGVHLGRISRGLIRDNVGDTAFFTDGSSGGPLKPVKRLKPLKSFKQLKPLKGLREHRPLKPLDTLTWSLFSGERFFRI